MLDRFFNFTTHNNSGFMIAFGDIVVSVSSHNYLDSFLAMKGNGSSGKIVENFSVRPNDIPCFTFNNAEICIFNQTTGKRLNKMFISPDADDYEEYIDPEMLVDILRDVMEYSINMHYYKKS